MTLLRCEGVNVSYDEIQAVRDVSLEIDTGQTVAVIGANGAGKTSLVNAISGGVRRSGRIEFAGEPIDRLPAHTIARRGLSQVPEGRRVLGSLTVEDNLLLGAFGDSRRERTERLRTVYDSLPVLAERAQSPAAVLSGGQQQMVAIGRALMRGPRLLLLDEPSMGLAPVIVDALFETIEALVRDGLTVLLVEQRALRTLEVADHVYVLHQGEVVISGVASELRNDPRIAGTYFGGDIEPASTETISTTTGGDST